MEASKERPCLELRLDRQQEDVGVFMERRIARGGGRGGDNTQSEEGWWW